MDEERENRPCGCPRIILCELIENCGPHNAGTGFKVRSGIEPKATVKEPYGRI